MRKVLLSVGAWLPLVGLAGCVSGPPSPDYGPTAFVPVPAPTRVRPAPNPVAVAPPSGVVRAGYSATDPPAVLKWGRPRFRLLGVAQTELPRRRGRHVFGASPGRLADAPTEHEERPLDALHKQA